MWAESRITGGSRRTISKRHGQVTSAKPLRISSSETIQSAGLERRVSRGGVDHLVGSQQWEREFNGFSAIRPDLQSLSVERMLAGFVEYIPTHQGQRSVAFFRHPFQHFQRLVLLGRRHHRYRLP